MRKEYNDRWTAPLREPYQSQTAAEDFTERLGHIVAPLIQEVRDV